MPSPGPPRADHLARGRSGETQSVTNPKGQEKSTSSIGRCGGLGRFTAELAPWARSPGVGELSKARAPPRPKRWLLTKPKASGSSARGDWWQEEERGQARDKLPGRARGFPSRRGRGSQVWQCPGVGTAVPGFEHPQRRAGRAEGVKELRRTATTPETQAEGRNTEARLEIAHHLLQPEGSRVAA